MNRNDIEAFLTIAEYGSITAAAKHLYIGQTTLSAKIRSLENELHATLFLRKRGQRNVELTTQGRTFEPYARKWISLWDETSTALSHHKNQTLQITANYITSSYLMPNVYSVISKHNPELPLKIWSHHSHESYSLLESGSADIGLVAHLQFSRGLKIYPLYREEMVLICKKNTDYPLNCNTTA